MGETKEICWNIINALIAGGLVFLGALTTGHLNTESIIASLIAAGIVALTQFRNYWLAEENEYCEKFKNTNVFQFV